MARTTFSLHDLSEDGAIAPLLHVYPWFDKQPQTAYLDIDENGQILAGWLEYGEGFSPRSAIHGKTRRLKLPSNVSRIALLEYLEGPAIPLLERIRTGYAASPCNDSSGGQLPQDAFEALQEFHEALQSLDCVPWEFATDRLQSLSFDEAWPRRRTLQQAAHDLQERARQEGKALAGDVPEALLDKAEREGLDALLQSERLDVVRDLCENPRRRFFGWEDIRTEPRFTPEGLAAAFGAHLPSPFEKLDPERLP